MKEGKRSKKGLPAELILPAVVLEGQWTRRVQPQQLEGAQKSKRAGVGLRFFFYTPNESEDLNTEMWHPKHPLIVPLLVGLGPPR